MPSLSRSRGAGISIDEFRRQLRRPHLGTNDRSGYCSVTGFVLERLHYLPEVGTTFQYDQLHFEVPRNLEPALSLPEVVRFRLT